MIKCMLVVFCHLLYLPHRFFSCLTHCYTAWEWSVLCHGTQFFLLFFTASYKSCAFSCEFLVLCYFSFIRKKSTQRKIAWEKMSHVQSWRRTRKMKIVQVMKNHHFMRMVACERRNEEYRRHPNGLWQNHSSYNCAENRYVYILCNCIFSEYLMKHCAAHRFCAIFHLSSCSTFFCFLFSYSFFYSPAGSHPTPSLFLFLLLSLIQIVNNEKFPSYFKRTENTWG